MKCVDRVEKLTTCTCGGAFNQLEAPLLEASSSAYFSLTVKLFKKLVFVRLVLSVLNVLIFCLFFSCSDVAVNGSYVSKADDNLIAHLQIFHSKRLA